MTLTITCTQLYKHLLFVLLLLPPPFLLPRWQEMAGRCLATRLVPWGQPNRNFTIHGAFTFHQKVGDLDWFRNHWWFSETLDRYDLMFICTCTYLLADHWMRFRVSQWKRSPKSFCSSVESSTGHRPKVLKALEICGTTTLALAMAVGGCASLQDQHIRYPQIRGSSMKSIEN